MPDAAPYSSSARVSNAPIILRSARSNTCPASISNKWLLKAKSTQNSTNEPPFPSGRKRQLLRSEEHTSELQSLMRISYAVFCLKKKTYDTRQKARSIHQRKTPVHIHDII